MKSALFVQNVPDVYSARGPSRVGLLIGLSLVGLLTFPLLGSAEELVGKPVPAGEQSSVRSSVSSTELQTSTASDTKLVSESVQSAIEEMHHENKGHDDESGENERQENERHEHEMHQDNTPGTSAFALSPDTLIPIVAMLLLFGGPVILVIVLATLHYRAKARRQQNINLNIDKLLAAGRDIPVELMLGEDVGFARTKGDDVVYARDDAMLHKGVRNIGLGLGVLIFLTVLCGFEIGAIGFILIGLGASRVVIWKLSGTKVDTSKSQDNVLSDTDKAQG